MLKLNVMTNLKPQDVIEKAKEFFGPSGHGLKISEQSDTYARFEGRGGGVEVIAGTDKNWTSVELLAREFEYQIGEFARKIQ